MGAVLVIDMICRQPGGLQSGVTVGLIDFRSRKDVNLSHRKG